MKLTLAYPDPAAQLLDTAVRTARKPADSGQDSLVERGGMFQRGQEQLAEDGSRAVAFGCSITFSSRMFRMAPLTAAIGIVWLSNSDAGMPSRQDARPGCSRAPVMLLPAGNWASKGTVHGPTTTGGSSFTRTMSMHASGSARCS